MITGDQDYGVPDDVVAAGRVFATPLRIAIVGQLAREPLTQAQLARALGTSDYAIGKHLQVLREAAVIGAAPPGRRRVAVQLDVKRMEALTQALRRYVAGRRR